MALPALTCAESSPPPVPPAISVFVTAFDACHCQLDEVLDVFELLAALVWHWGHLVCQRRVHELHELVDGVAQISLGDGVLVLHDECTEQLSPAAQRTRTLGCGQRNLANPNPAVDGMANPNPKPRQGQQASSKQIPKQGNFPTPLCKPALQVHVILDMC